jgi:CheY-like chemotaxis protein
MVRSALLEVLDGLDYEVLEASNGELALELARTFEGSISVLLTEVMMPGMSGVEVARRFRDMHPTARVIFMSAYANDEVEMAQVSAAGDGFLRKPFTRPDLVNAITAAVEA